MVETAYPRRNRYRWDRLPNCTRRAPVSDDGQPSCVRSWSILELCIGSSRRIGILQVPISIGGHVNTNGRLGTTSPMAHNRDAQVMTGAVLELQIQAADARCVVVLEVETRITQAVQSNAIMPLSEPVTGKEIEIAATRPILENGIGAAGRITVAQIECARTGVVLAAGFDAGAEPVAGQRDASSNTRCELISDVSVTAAVVQFEIEGTGAGVEQPDGCLALVSPIAGNRR